MPDSSIDRIVIRRVVHRLVAERLIERVYNQPLISNVDRGAYVECMVELALSESRPPWSLTDTWAAWDLEQRQTGARIEVKQSAARQTWSASGALKSSPSFDIRPRNGYYIGGDVSGSEWFETGLMRHADLYVMAWHGEQDVRIADHRQPEQWQFYVVPEHRLPAGQKTIGLNPLGSLSTPCRYEDVSGMVERALESISGLKADLVRD